jgi:hypothetical protein
MRFGVWIFRILGIAALICSTGSPLKATDAPQGHVANVAGKWQVSWTGRLGTETAVLQLNQDGGAIKGTFQDMRGASSLSGKVEDKNVSFDVIFQGKRPFTIVFTGAVDDDKITGTSKAKDADGYLGHGGEIVQPEHPWTATRMPDESAPQKP